LWWCLILAPVAGVVIFMLPPLLLVLAGAAFVAAVDSVVDRHLTFEQRLIGLLLVAAVIPAGFLSIYIFASLGLLEGATAFERVVTLAAAVVWVVALLALKPRAWKILKKTE
jgi:hypothetical protein